MKVSPLHYMAVGFLIFGLSVGVESAFSGNYWEALKFIGISLIGLWGFKLQVRAIARSCKCLFYQVYGHIYRRDPSGQNRHRS